MSNGWTRLFTGAGILGAILVIGVVVLVTALYIIQGA